jgi:peroxiredoxin
LPEIGDLAPDFELRSQHGEPIRLSDFRGVKSVLVVFYPFAFSHICTRELGELADYLAQVGDETLEVLAISCDSVQVQRAFARDQALDFSLLSDFWPHGAVSRSYDVFSEQAGAALRGSFLVDTDGVLRWSVVNGMGEARDLAGYQAALSAV